MQASPPRVPFVLIPTSAHPASPTAARMAQKAALSQVQDFSILKLTAVRVPLQRAPLAVAACFISHRTILHLFLQYYAICIERQKSPLLTSAGRVVWCCNTIFTKSQSDKFPLGCTKTVNVPALDLEWAWIVMLFIVILHLKTISVWLKHMGCFSKTHFEFCPNRMFARRFSSVRYHHASFRRLSSSLCQSFSLRLLACLL